MRFEWDPGKAVANRQKHGISFPDAIGALEDPFALTRPDDRAPEPRFATVGADLLGRVVVVIWTGRGDAIRLISARRATPHERRLYEER
jgi:uncharacterized DUF497 family protein